MKFVDANIFLRLILWDNPIKAEKCQHLFVDALVHKKELCTTNVVIAEIIWVLERQYKYHRTKIAEVVLNILNTHELHVLDKDLLMVAVSLYQMSTVDYIDAYNATFMQKQHIKDIYSYDSDFDTLKNVKRLLPYKLNQPLDLSIRFCGYNQRIKYAKKEKSQKKNRKKDRC